MYTDGQGCSLDTFFSPGQGRRKQGGWGATAPLKFVSGGLSPPKIPFRWNSSNVYFSYNCVTERLEWFYFRIFVMLYYVRRNVVDTRVRCSLCGQSLYLSSNGKFRTRRYVFEIFPYIRYPVCTCNLCNGAEKHSLILLYGSPGYTV